MNSKITEQHRSRPAYIYVRQSTNAQVLHHQESTERQYALRTMALELGWSESAIRTLDRDLGMTGTEMSRREDFKTLVADVSMGRVGAVFALEVSRLARSNLDWHRLLELCALTETLQACMSLAVISIVARSTQRVGFKNGSRRSPCRTGVSACKITTRGISLWKSSLRTRSAWRKTAPMARGPYWPAPRVRAWLFYKGCFCVAPAAVALRCTTPAMGAFIPAIYATGYVAMVWRVSTA